MSLAKELLELSKNSNPGLAQAEYEYICKRMRRAAERGLTEYLYHFRDEKVQAAGEVIVKLEADGLTVKRKDINDHCCRLTISWGE